MVVGVVEAWMAFEAVPRAPSHAREFLMITASSWGVLAAAMDALVMVSSELVTNVVEHARTRGELSLAFDGSVFTVHVRDDSEAAPIVRPHDPAAARGRGMQVVEALALRWGCIPRLGGKTVWADVALGV